MINKELILKKCKKLLYAYRNWLLGDVSMPEDAHPIFIDNETRLVYFTLPMSLNYQRNSFGLRNSVLISYNDIVTRDVFDIWISANLTDEDLRVKLLKHKIALQPNKHINTRSRISKTIYENRWSIWWLLEACEYDFLKLQELVQKKHKKWFPYLSGPKIFHYWCFILWEYCDILLKNTSYIQIAPDTHVMQSSVKLWVLSQEEIDTFSRDAISQRWREVLADTGTDPIHMHSPLRFWSRSGFEYDIK